MNMHVSVPASFAEYVIQFAVRDIAAVNFVEYVIHHAVFFRVRKAFTAENL